jgi:ribosomal protein S18 acetylase RimI-like enzyme
MNGMHRNDTKRFRWIEAAPDDEDAVFALMREFYTEERIVLRDGARASLREMLRNPQLGRVLLLKNPGEPEAAPCGYIALAFWHTLEFGGRVVVLDEFYLAPACRGRGLGREGVGFVREWAKKNGAAAVRLEVNHHNKRAKELYLKAGFGDDRRDIMTAIL